MTDKFIEGRIVERVDFTNSLFALRFEADLPNFSAGQYCRAGLFLGDAAPRVLTLRPYSLVNPPEDRPHEILLSLVAAAEGGVLSPHLHALTAGDRLWFGPRCNGGFTLQKIPPANTLWCFAAGTGIGPFLSLLRSTPTWEQFSQIVLVHGARHVPELAYRERLEALSCRYGQRFRYVSMLTGDTQPGSLSGRIPAAITDGRLIKKTGLMLTASDAHCMVCGSTRMVADTVSALMALGLRPHRHDQPGQITTEAYG